MSRRRRCPRLDLVIRSFDLGNVQLVRLLPPHCAFLRQRKAALRVRDEDEGLDESRVLWDDRVGTLDSWPDCAQDRVPVPGLGGGKEEDTILEASLAEDESVLDERVFRHERLWKTVAMS